MSSIDIRTQGEKSEVRKKVHRERMSQEMIKSRKVESNSVRKCLGEAQLTNGRNGNLRPLRSHPSVPLIELFANYVMLADQLSYKAIGGKSKYF